MTDSSVHLIAMWVLWLFIRLHFWSCQWFENEYEICFTLIQFTLWSQWRSTGLYKYNLLKHLSFMPQVVYFLSAADQAWWLWDPSWFICTGSKVYNKTGKLNLERKDCTLDSFCIKSAIIIPNLKSRCIRLNIRNCFLLSKFTLQNVIKWLVLQEEEMAMCNFYHEIQLVCNMLEYRYWLTYNCCIFCLAKVDAVKMDRGMK